MCADTGIGILYARKSWLKMLEPIHVGGGAINYVRTDDHELAGLPDRWQPGTLHLTGLLSLAAAMDFLTQYLDEYKNQEQEMIQGILERFSTYPDIQLIGSQETTNRLPVFSFTHASKHV